MDKLKKNGSGYNDPTAYEAIRIKRGDIYYVEESVSVGHELGGNRPAVIVSNDAACRFSGVLEVVYLTGADKKPLPTHVKILAERESTAMCENVYSVSVDRLGRKIGKCSDAEMAAIDNALLVSLDLQRFSDAEGFEELSGDTNGREYGRLEAERDTYKHLYSSLLERILGGVANV